MGETTDKQNKKMCGAKLNRYHSCGPRALVWRCANSLTRDKEQGRQQKQTTYNNAAQFRHSYEREQHQGYDSKNQRIKESLGITELSWLNPGHGGVNRAT